jgi:hypothetical protein
MAKFYGQQLVQPVPGYGPSRRSAATAAFSLPSLPADSFALPDDFALPALSSGSSRGSSVDELAAAARRRKAAQAVRRPAPSPAPKTLDVQSALYLAGMSLGVFVGTTLGLAFCGIVGL